MPPLVIVLVAESPEVLVADFAFVGLGVVMDAHMDFQVAFV